MYKTIYDHAAEITKDVIKARGEAINGESELLETYLSDEAVSNLYKKIFRVLSDQKYFMRLPWDRIISSHHLTVVNHMQFIKIPPFLAAQKAVILGNTPSSIFSHTSTGSPINEHEPQ